MNSRLEAFKCLFNELGMTDKIELAHWLWTSQQELLEYSYLGEAERRMWAHFYPNVTSELGVDTNTLSGNRKIEEQK